ncbi:4Fe-4S binding protein [bacterium]|nr:4Fe-4S binding protein [bacterium]
MMKQWKKTGVASMDEVEKILPSRERRAKGGYVVIECFENIPCDPCHAACPFGAILPFENINDLPKVDYDRCTGCGICVPLCPGLAIFVVNEAASEDTALIAIPYELLPIPQKGDKVKGLDREGKIVCEATVHKVIPGKNKTITVWISVPKQFANIVRHFK